MAKTTKLLSLNEFAFQLGAQTRVTRDASFPFHVAYVESSAEDRTAMRQTWLVSHVQGSLGVSEKAAATIVAAGKGAECRKPEHFDALQCAGAHFSYHVVRRSAEKHAARAAKGASQETKVRCSAAEKAAFAAFMATFDDRARAGVVFAALFKATA